MINLSDAVQAICQIEKLALKSITMIICLASALNVMATTSITPWSTAIPPSRATLPETTINYFSLYLATTRNVNAVRSRSEVKLYSVHLHIKSPWYMLHVRFYNPLMVGIPDLCIACCHFIYCEKIDTLHDRLLIAVKWYTNQWKSHVNRRYKIYSQSYKYKQLRLGINLLKVQILNIIIMVFFHMTKLFVWVSGLKNKIMLMQKLIKMTFIMGVLH